jgi:hypothetical protein
VFLGVASGALPLTCFVGLSACRAAPDVVQPAAPVVAEVASAASSQAPSVPASAAPPPTLTRNDVVGATFAMLNVDLAPPPEDGELKTRVVKTVTIGPDGQPVGVAPAAAAAPSTSKTTAKVATAGPFRQIAAAPRIAASGAHASAPSTPAEAILPGKTAVATELAVDPPKANSRTAVVKNSGANVRSSPSKGKSRVLFALPGGTTVTIGENSHGWLKVTDSRGRTGWVYQDLLVRD